LKDDDAEDKRQLIGFDRNANPLEAFYNILDKNTVRVFHAMKRQNIHRDLRKNIWQQYKSFELIL